MTGTPTNSNAEQKQERIWQRMSCSTYALRHHRPVCEQALRELASYGIRTIELNSSNEQFNLARWDSMKHILRDCQAAGVQIGAYHARETIFSDLETDQQRRERTDECKRQLDTMVQCGAKIWGSHLKITDYGAEDCLAELLEHTADTDVRIVLENKKGMASSVENTMAFLDRIDHPRLGLLLDIGHVRDASGSNPLTVPGGPTELIQHCGRRLVHTHLHGFVNGKDHYPPFYQDDVMQWEELFRNLIAADYQGYFNFESGGYALYDNTFERIAQVPSMMANLS